MVSSTTLQSTFLNLSFRAPEYGLLTWDFGTTLGFIWVGYYEISQIVIFLCICIFEFFCAYVERIQIFRTVLDVKSLKTLTLTLGETPRDLHENGCQRGVKKASHCLLYATEECCNNSDDLYLKI